MKPAIHIGTSGWSYKHWKNIFYPDKLKNAAWLEFYATYFKCTELNSSFYHLPKKQTTMHWAEKMPSNFKFCPKMSRYVTHMKKLNEPEEGLQHFFDVMAPLKKKLGPILIQLPPFLKFNIEKATQLYQLCKKQYPYYRFAIEVRHNTWLEKESIELMKKYNIAFVIAQSGHDFPYAEFITAQHIYVRFHGPKELYASSYTDKELQYFATLLKKWKTDGHTVWAFFNNDIHGYAIANAKKLVQLTNHNY